MVNPFDVNGRSYALVSEVKVGSILVADGGFVSEDGEKDIVCIAENVELAVAADEHGYLFVPCFHGRHYLDGQFETDDEGTEFYVGLYMKGN